MPFETFTDSDDEGDFGFGFGGAAGTQGGAGFGGKRGREGKDACLFVVDCREAMFRAGVEEEDEDGDVIPASAPPILDVIELIYRVYDLEILASSRDVLGVTFVGAGAAKPADGEDAHFKTVHHFIKLGRPDAESSHRLKALCRNGGVGFGDGCGVFVLEACWLAESDPGAGN